MPVLVPSPLGEEPGMSVSHDFNVTEGIYLEGRNDLARRILDGWRDMPASVRRLVAEAPSEGRLLFYVLLSDLIFFVSWSAKTLLIPTPDAISDGPSDIAFWLVVALLCRTSAMYIFSMVAGAGARLAGGKASWPETRAAVFWGALVAAPVGFIIAIIVSVAAASGLITVSGGSVGAAPAPHVAGFIPFVWFVSAGVAEVHGFRRAWIVGAAIVVSSMAALAYLTHIGVNIPL